MDEKREGPALPPLPVADPRFARARRRPGDSGELPCEMCGAPVIAYQCKRICLHCGFMTGCSEGIS